MKKSYEELEKENAELKRQLEERQNVIRYESIANEIIGILANHNIEFWEIPGTLELVKLKCRYQNLGKSLD